MHTPDKRERMHTPDKSQREREREAALLAEHSDHVKQHNGTHPLSLTIPQHMFLIKGWSATGPHISHLHCFHGQLTILISTVFLNANLHSNKMIKMFIFLKPY